MGTAKADNRQQQIIELISQKGTMKITELATHFQVSRETIRRDLQTLDKSGAIKKWYGAVMPAQNFDITPVEQRLTENYEAKHKICMAALNLIPDRAVIFIDAGSTALTMANILKEKSGYTIITNSTPVITELTPSANHIISIGGSINPLTSATVGTQALNFIEKIKMDVALLGSSGFAEHKGPTGNSFDDGEIKQKIIENTRLNIVLADSTKSTYSSLTQYVDWRDIDYLITDAAMTKTVAEQLNKQTEVIVAS